MNLMRKQPEKDCGVGTGNNKLTDCATKDKRTLLYQINAICLIFRTVGAVLRCTHPNAICIPNRTGSSNDSVRKMLDTAQPK